MKFVCMLHYLTLFFRQDLVNDVSMLEADMAKLKCHADRLMSMRHPAAAIIQVRRCSNVTPDTC